MIRVRWFSIAACCAGCANFLSIDDATVTVLQDPSTSSSDASSSDGAPDASYAPSDASSETAVLEDAGVTSPCIINGQPCLVDCRSGVCRNTEVRCGTRPCLIRCEGDHACFRIVCAKTQPCVVECIGETACVDLVVMESTGPAACVRCFSSPSSACSPTPC